MFSVCEIAQVAPAIQVVVWCLWLRDFSNILWTSPETTQVLKCLWFLNFD